MKIKYLLLSSVLVAGFTFNVSASENDEPLKTEQNEGNPGDQTPIVNEEPKTADTETIETAKTEETAKSFLENYPHLLRNVGIGAGSLAVLGVSYYYRNGLMNGSKSVYNFLKSVNYRGIYNSVKANPKKVCYTTLAAAIAAPVAYYHKPVWDFTKHLSGSVAAFSVGFKDLVVGFWKNGNNFFNNESESSSSAM